MGNKFWVLVMDRTSPSKVFDSFGDLKRNKRMMLRAGREISQHTFANAQEAETFRQHVIYSASQKDTAQ